MPNKHTVEKATAVVLCIASLIGLSMGIPYSGWLMFAGIMMALN